MSYSCALAGLLADARLTPDANNGVLEGDLMPIAGFDALSAKRIALARRAASLRACLPLSIAGCTGAFIVLLPVVAGACTLCHSPLAAEVRLWVQSRFWLDLTAVLACIPFLVIAVLLAGHEPQAPGA